MPVLRRPGAVEIHWEERGAGPLVLFLHHCFSHPAVYEGLCDELARDHRVVTYDPRGTGESTRTGPFDLLVDVEDLEALADDLGGDAVAVGLGDGRDRAARVAWSRPDLIGAVVGCDATPMGRFTGAEVEAPSASRAVLEAVVGLARSNHRTAMRGILEFTNPGMTDADLRRRLDAEVAYSSQEAIRARSQWFLRTDLVEAARAIRDRLWIAYWESEWTPPDVVGKIHEVLPEARVHPVAAGPISRPDLTAEVVRKVTGSSESVGGR
jgi:pimeloyl-ACP methyl ester carboxylesterase